jgi:hypothetical protein
MSNGEGSSEVKPPLNEVQSFYEIVALLSEILVLDFQQHKAVTVGSPPETRGSDLLDVRK